MKSISISDNPGWLVSMHTERHTADVEGKGGVVISTEQVFDERCVGRRGYFKLITLACVYIIAHVTCDGDRMRSAAFERMMLVKRGALMRQQRDAPFSSRCTCKIAMA